VVVVVVVMVVVVVDFHELFADDRFLVSVRSWGRSGACAGKDSGAVGRKAAGEGDYARRHHEVGRDA
jgi:hypothetical protein